MNDENDEQEESPLVKKGEVVILTAGEYSDYTLLQEVVFTQDVDLRELVAKYRETTNPENMVYGDKVAEFAMWMVLQGVCLFVQLREIHLGDHRTFDGRFVKSVPYQSPRK